MAFRRRPDLQLQHPVDVRHHLLGRQYVLENGLDPHAIDRPFAKWRRVRVGDEVSVFGPVYVECNNANAVILVESFRAAPHCRASNDEHDENVIL